MPKGAYSFCKIGFVTVSVYILQCKLSVPVSATCAMCIIIPWKTKTNYYNCVLNLFNSMIVRGIDSKYSQART